MHRRDRCLVCGASLPAGAGHCPTCGRDRGTDVVDLGGTPEHRPGEERRRSRSRPVSLAVVVVAVAVIGILAAVDRGAGPATEAAASSTTHPPTTTDAEPRRGDGEPLLGRPTGIRLGVAGPNGVRVFDLDTGDAVFEVRGGFQGLGTVVPRDAGLVLVVRGVASYFPDLSAGEAGITPIALGLAESVLPSDQHDRVWLRQGEVFGSAPLTLTEVELSGRVVSGPIELPSDARPVGPAAGGVVVNTSDGIFHIGRDGSRRRVAPGVAFGAHETTVVHRACDDDLRCAVYVTDIVGGQTRLIPGTEATVGTTLNTALRPDGAVLAAFLTGGQRDLVIIDLADGTVLHRSANALRDGSGLAWSPDGRWLFWPQFAGVGALAVDGWELHDLDLSTGFTVVAFGGGG
jgi:hypothetical protein